MEILARAAEQPVGAVPGLAIVVVVGVVIVALTGLSRSIAADRGSDRRLAKAERQGREQAEEAARDAVVLRLAELLPEPEPGVDRKPAPTSEVDLTGGGTGEQIDLTPRVDLTEDEREPDRPPLPE